MQVTPHLYASDSLSLGALPVSIVQSAPTNTRRKGRRARWKVEVKPGVGASSTLIKIKGTVVSLEHPEYFIKAEGSERRTSRT